MSGLTVKSVSQGLEKYLMTKFYSRTFGQSMTDRERDESVSHNLQALGFVRPEHLEIPETYIQDDMQIILAAKELQKLNKFKVHFNFCFCVVVSLLSWVTCAVHFDWPKGKCFSAIQ